MRPGEFIRLLWQPALEQKASPDVLDGCVTIWELQGKSSFHVGLDTLDGWDAEDDELDGWRVARDVYTSPGLRVSGLSQSERGTKKDVIALCGIVLDVDINGPGHKAANLPNTLDDVDRIMGEGPEPSVVVATGGGFHFWWLFEEPFETLTETARTYAHKAFAAFQRRYIERANLLGFHLDKTHSIDRVFRLPGTFNHKNEKQGLVVPVEVVDQTGKRYPSDQLMMIPAPRSGATKTKSFDDAQPAPGGAEPGTVAALKKALARLSEKHANKDIIASLVKGESFAARGERDYAMQRAVSTVVFHNNARKLTEDDIPELVELFRPSLSVWASEDDAEKSVDDELEKVTEKMERAFQERDEKRTKQNRAKELVRKRFERRSAEAAASPATEAATRAWNKNETPAPEAPDADDPAPTSAEDEGVYPLIVHEGDVWLWSFGKQHDNVQEEDYYGPYRNDDFVVVQAKKLWEGVEDEDLALTYETAKGEVKVKKKAQLVQEYGVPAMELVHKLSLQKSYYDDKTLTFYEAPCPLKVDEELFDPQVDEWLRLLGGPDADKLLDWIAAVPILDRACCALYLQGPQGCGKSILGDLLSLLWGNVGDGPTRFASVMNGFNGLMFRQPFIQLDEGLPKDAKQTSAFIRELVASRNHIHNEKFKPMFHVQGSIRLMIAANNDRVLEQLSNEELGEHDVEALAKRFLHIRGQREATEWIEQMNAQDRSVIDKWFSERKVARHCLWLALNRDIVPGSRFLVEGGTTDIHRNLVTKGRNQHYVLEWLARFALKPSIAENFYKQKNEKPLAFIGGSQLLVNTQAVVSQPLTGDEAKRRIPSPSQVGRVLGLLSSGTRQIGGRGDRVKFHLINFENVKSAAEDLQLDIDAMEANFKREPNFVVDPEPHLKLVP